MSCRWKLNHHKESCLCVIDCFRLASLGNCVLLMIHPQFGTVMAIKEKCALKLRGIGDRKMQVSLQIRRQCQLE